MGRIVFNDDCLGLSGPVTDWQSELRRAVTDPVELCRRLAIDPGLASTEASRRFPVLVPEPLLGRIRRGDPADPILCQVLPTAAELRPAPGFSADPLGEASHETSPGQLRRYAGRSLIITTGRCGVHCRYCFRRGRLEGAGAPPIVDRRLRRSADTDLPPLTLPSPLLFRCAGRGEGKVESADRLTI